MRAYSAALQTGVPTGPTSYDLPRDSTSKALWKRLSSSKPCPAGSGAEDGDWSWISYLKGGDLSEGESEGGR
jgi:hypothetical protein